MESKEDIKCPSEINEFEWFLVQCDHSHKKIIHKIVKKTDLIWSEIPQSLNGKEIVLIRGPEKPDVAYIIYKAKTYKDATKQHTFLQTTSLELFSSRREIDEFMINKDYRRQFWLLVIYSTIMRNKKQSVFAIFHTNEVMLKKDQGSNRLLAYIREGEGTYRGVVVKVTDDLNHMMFMMDYIKNKLLKMFERDIIIGNEIIPELKRVEEKMYRDSDLLWKLINTAETNHVRKRHRRLYLQIIGNRRAE